MKEKTKEKQKKNKRVKAFGKGKEYRDIYS